MFELATQTTIHVVPKKSYLKKKCFLAIGSIVLSWSRTNECVDIG